MDPQRPNRILDEWASVAASARRPAAPPRRVVMRSGLASPGLLGGGLALVALVLAVVWLGRPDPNGSTGDVPTPAPSAVQTAEVTPPATPAPSASASPSPAPTLSPTPAPTPTATPAPTPTAAPTIGPCAAASLAARITSWEGAAGNRIATVELTNTGSERCTVHALSRPQLVDGKGSVLIDGTTPPASKSVAVGPGDRLSTLVDVANYCGPDPLAPISVAFVLGGGAGRIVATPVSPTDLTLPPCNGAPGSAGDIAMQPWAS